MLAAVVACSRPLSEIPPGLNVVRALDYGGQGNPRQVLDLYTPRQRAEPQLPLVVFLHGGGWEEGSRTDQIAMPLALTIGGAFLVASIDFRLTDEATFPAQIHDAKGAVRWLRAHADDYGIDASRIGAFGYSAGGQLAGLLGTSAGIAGLEGSVGRHADEDSRVSCVVSMSAPSSFGAYARQGGGIDAEDDGSAIGKLLGGGVSKRGDAARAASPLTYVSADDAPFLHVHGSEDAIVPVAQAREFDAALDAAGVASTLVVAEGGNHAVYGPDVAARIRDFFDRCLRGRNIETTEDPLYR